MLTVRKQIIHIGDCLKVLETIPDESVDVIVTSPPYNIGLAYATYNDNKTPQEYLDWLDDISGLLFNVLKEDGSLFLNVGSTNINPWIANDVADVFRHGMWQLQNNIVWVKSISIGEDTYGHFKPVNSKRFLNHTHESIFHFTKERNVTLDRLSVGVPFMDKSNISRRKHAQDKRCAGDVWYMPYKTVQTKTEKYNHPGSFCIELPERCIKLHGGNNLTILDPFLGIGTTLLAAERLGHSGIGIELDSGYAQTAFARISEGLCITQNS